MNSDSDRKTVRTVDAELLFQELRSNRRVTILDVRTREEFFGPGGRLPGARSLPADVPMSCCAAGCHPSEPVVTVSWNDGRSQMAARQLEAAGFTEVRALAGGLCRWLELGFPTEGPAGFTRRKHDSCALEIDAANARWP